MATILLIRHGQASLGADDYDQLSPLGLTQARHLGDAWRRRGLRVATVSRGTLRRHEQTAAASLAARLGGRSGAGSGARPQEGGKDGIPVATVRPGLDEFDHMDLLGRVAPHLAARGALRVFLAERADGRRAMGELLETALLRWVRAAPGEYRLSWPDFAARARAALDDVIAGLAGREGDGAALVYTSGGVITALCQPLLGLPDTALPLLLRTLTNAGVTKLVAARGQISLSTLNDHSHLERPDDAGRSPLITYL